MNDTPLPGKPLFLDIALTSRCPLFCRYCTVARDPQPELSAGEWNRVVAAFARVRRIDLISLEGGEPLTRPDLPEILAACLAHARWVKIVTSGVIPFARLPDELLRRPGFFFELSLDGPEEIHDFLRDGSGRKARAFLAAGLARRVPMKLRSVISRHNIAIFESWLTRLDKDLAPFGQKVEFSFDTLIDPGGLAGQGGGLSRVRLRNYPAYGLLPAPAEMGKLFARLKSRPFANLVLGQNEPLRGCRAGRRGVISFDPAGVISFCCEAPRGVGSIRRLPAHECLALLDAQTRNSPCPDCEYFQGRVCNGCGTGQKCGMVKYWKAEDCRALHRSLLGDAPFARREMEIPRAGRP